MHIDVTPKIRRGEAGTIVLHVPETEGLKSLAIDVPSGVINPSGSLINLAPKMKYVDIPLLLTKDAPEEFTIKFHLFEQTRKGRPHVEITSELAMKIRK